MKELSEHTKHEILSKLIKTSSHLTNNEMRNAVEWLKELQLNQHIEEIGKIEEGSDASGIISKVKYRLRAIEKGEELVAVKAKEYTNPVIASATVEKKQNGNWAIFTE